jgi:uncharacterized protein YPO0396
MTLPNQRAEDIRQGAQDNYLETMRQVELKRLDITRTERQLAALRTEEEALTTTARQLRCVVLGEVSL